MISDQQTLVVCTSQHTEIRPAGPLAQRIFREQDRESLPASEQSLDPYLLTLATQIDEDMADIVRGLQPDEKLHDLAPSSVRSVALGSRLASVTIGEVVVPILLRSVPIDTIVLMAGAVVTGQKVMVVSDPAAIVGLTPACVLALTCLVHPVEWQSPLILMLPHSMREVFDFPGSILLGIPAAMAPDVTNTLESEAVRLVLSTKDVLLPTVEIHRQARHLAHHSEDGGASTPGEAAVQIGAEGFLRVQLPNSSKLCFLLDQVAGHMYNAKTPTASRTWVSSANAAQDRHAARQVLDVVRNHVDSLLREVFTRVEHAAHACSTPAVIADANPGELVEIHSSPGRSCVQIARNVDDVIRTVLESAEEVEVPFWRGFLQCQSVVNILEDRLGLRVSEGEADMDKKVTPAMATTQRRLSIVGLTGAAAAATTETTMSPTSESASPFTTSARQPATSSDSSATSSSDESQLRPARAAVVSNGHGRQLPSLPSPRTPRRRRNRMSALKARTVYQSESSYSSDFDSSASDA